MEILHSPVNLDITALKDSLKIRKGSEDERAFENYVTQAKEIGRPKAIVKVAYIEARHEDQVTIGNAFFRSAALVKNLEPINRVFPYVATCGSEVDSIEVDAGNILAAYWLNAIKLALLHNAIEHVKSDVKKRYQIENLSAMNPGSGDVSVWPIEQQTALFSVFGDVEAQIGVRLLPSYLMMPEMSVSGVLFQTDTVYINCQLCQRENCPGRRAPFDCELWAAVNA